MAKPILQKVTRTQIVYRGLTKAARLWGCSRPHLSYVLHGQRKPSPRLARENAKMAQTAYDLMYDAKKKGSAK